MLASQISSWSPYDIGGLGLPHISNRSAPDEFWSLYDGPLTVEHVAPQLSRYEFYFNYERPHASLAYRTPNEYVVAQEAA